MKTITKYLSLLIVLIFLSNCSASPICWGKDKNKGIIESSTDFELCNCEFDEKEYLIDSDALLDSLFNIENLQSYQCEKPDIDFTKYTLLGQYASGGCEVKYIREVEKDENNKQYVYTIKVRDCGTCKRMRVNWNWVLVPKLPNGWTVKFEVI